MRPSLALVPRLVVLIGGLVLGGLVPSCSGGNTTIPECGDGIDNDGDGLIDDADPGCIAGDAEAADPAVACNDTLDNDGDGLTDFPDDPGCDSATDTDEFNVRTPDCRDGMDNDGDGKTDYPDDPGCFSPNQDGEEDDCPSGPNCPECADGEDNDFDGATDYPADSACASASGSLEFMPDANACGAGTIITDLPSSGSAFGSIPPGMGNISSTTCNGRGGEHAYLFVVDRPVTLVASTESGTTADTVLYVRTNCLQAATEVACNDNVSPTNTRSRLTVDLQPGTYYLVVDGRDLTSMGNYMLTALFYEGLGEDCTGAANCAPGYTCRAVAPATQTTCEKPVCSDGRDDDGDTKIDFPLDPGCTSLTDSTEEDTCPGVGCPVCADGMDNDLDGATDYPADSSCFSASATSEADCPAETEALLPITGTTLAGTTAGATNGLDGGTCDSSSSNAPDRAYLLDLRVPLESLTMTLTTPFDAVLSFLDATCTTSIACSDPGTITRSNVGAGRYIVSVDGYSTGSGTYTLNVRGTIAVRGRCNDPLVAAGVLTCADNSACAGAAGMETCVPAQCNDLLDADGDGFPGYPTDPGCDSLADNDETDDCPAGPNCPQCSNDLDDDADGFTDYPADLGCVAASTTNEECASIDPTIPFTANVVGASTVGRANDVDLTCGADGLDDVYRLHVAAPLSELRVNTIGSALDTILAIKSGGCASFDLQCDDNTAGNGDSSIFLIDLEPGDYFLVVDDKNAPNPGTYNLNVSGLYANGAACDPASPFFTCNPGLVCSGTTPTCGLAACNDTVDDDGDGFVGFPTDPGCASPSDNDETDDCPSGPTCPACSNGLDDDGDGFTDYPLDVGCSAAGVDSEAECQAETDPLLMVTSRTTVATTVGAANDFRATCGFSSGAAGDRVHLLQVRVPLATLHLETTTSFDNTLSLGTVNCDSTIVCADTPVIDRSNVAPGTYSITVDGWNTATGAYTLTVGGTIVAGGACNDPLVAAGVFTCPAGQGCAGPAGSETCQPAACNDAIDEDGDGFPGYPSDPGCTSISDTTETDDCPSGPNCPACSNDLDDDADGFIDYPLDTSCASAAGAIEFGCPQETDETLLVTGPSTAGATTGLTNNLTPTCGLSTGTSPDRIHMLQVRIPLATLHLDTNPTGFDNTLSLMGPSCGSTIQCADTPIIDRTNVAPGNYPIVVDGWSSGSGTYTLNVSGTIAGGASCSDPLVTAGVFTCATGYFCTGAPGTQTCTPAACNDTIDADGDGFPGFPTDPGCASTSDNDETDSCPNGPTCPACSNDLDDDSDGFIDYPLDTGCSSASGTTELGCAAETEPLIPVTMPATPGTTVGSMNNLTPTCGSSTHTAGERVHSLVLRVPVATLHVDTNPTGFDNALSLTDSTCTSTIQCADNPIIDRTNVAAGSYQIVVDGWGSGTGTYTLNVRGTIATGNSCEDPLVTAGVLTCATGSACGGAVGSRVCRPAACSDAIDADGDGFPGYPTDPGCTSIGDDDETDDCPAGPNCPVCSDDLDNDTDGTIDYGLDFSCLAASQNTEADCPAEVDPLLAVTGPTMTSTTVGAGNNFDPPCQTNDLGDRVFILNLHVPVATLTVDTIGSTLSDTVLMFMNAACGLPPIDCNDDGSGLYSLITRTNVAPGGYAIEVDQYGSAGTVGPFTLHVKGTLPTGGACNDPLVPLGVLVCPTGQTCQAGVCAP